MAVVPLSGLSTLVDATTLMGTKANSLYKKLKALPPRRRAEVEDFVDFLTRKESRGAALDRLLAVAPALEVAEAPRMTDADLAAEIRAARAERRLGRARAARTGPTARRPRAAGKTTRSPAKPRKRA